MQPRKNATKNSIYYNIAYRMESPCCVPLCALNGKSSAHVLVLVIMNFIQILLDLSFLGLL